MKKIGLFYSFNTQSTASVAKRIKEAFGEGAIEEVNAENLSSEKLLSYENLILGVPTWFDGELPNYWDEFVPALLDLDLQGKKVAIFGLGDQKQYPDNFCDAVGTVADLLSKRGATIVGETLNENYTFDASLALRVNHFCGLILDGDNQPELSAPRIEEWVDGLKKVF